MVFTRYSFCFDSQENEKSGVNLLLLLPAELQTIVIDYWKRMYVLEGEKHDAERMIRIKEMEVTTKLAQLLCLSEPEKSMPQWYFFHFDVSQSDTPCWKRRKKNIDIALMDVTVLPCVFLFDFFSVARWQGAKQSCK